MLMINKIMMNRGGLLNAAKALVRFPALYDDCLGQIRSSITGGTQYYKINPVRTFDSYAYNIKKNACFTVNGFNTTYTTKGGGGGSYSVNVEIPFNEKHGVAIRVLPNEKITMKVNDNLSSLTGYRTSILGHVVE